MFEDLRRQKAYLWYARYAELNRIQFWQSVCDDVQTLSFRRDPETRVSRLRQELHQLERELGREFLRTVAKQDCWGGMLPDWVVNAGPRKEPNASLERASLQRASLERVSG
jgi:hypothetical protein